MKNIIVIGAGTMGNGIAHVFAQNDFKVTLVDVSKEALDKAVNTITKNLDRMIQKEKISEEDKSRTLSNIATQGELGSAVGDADLVIEAVLEDVELKSKIFSELAEKTNESAILASNTSSISITKIGSFTKNAANVIGMHFMNPVPVMKLVEVIRGYTTSDETTEKIMELSRQLGKVPVEVKDYPGFVANRILMPMINEAIYALYESVSGVEEIDTIMKLGTAHPMGPFQLADFIGLDVCLSIMNVLHTGFGNSKYAPCPLLVNMVQAGQLGRKSGEGFYEYSKDSKDLVVAGQFRNRELV